MFEIFKGEREQIVRVSRFIPIYNNGFVMHLREKEPFTRALEFPGYATNGYCMEYMYSALGDVRKCIGDNTKGDRVLTYLTSSQSVVNSTKYISDFWITQQVYIPDPQILCNGEYTWISSEDFSDLHSKEEFAFNHYYVALRVANELSNQDINI